MSEQPSSAIDSSTIKSILEQIKDRISEAVPRTDPPQKDSTTFYVEDQNGIKAYGGKPLEKKVPELVKGLELGKVREIGDLNSIM